MDQRQVVRMAGLQEPCFQRLCDVVGLLKPPDPLNTTVAPSNTWWAISSAVIQTACFI